MEASESSPVWHRESIGRDEMWARTNTKGVTLWLTGLSGSGKSTIANAVARKVFDAGHFAMVLDGDNLRFGLNADLGFSDDDLPWRNRMGRPGVGQTESISRSTG